MNRVLMITGILSLLVFLSCRQQQEKKQQQALEHYYQAGQEISAVVQSALLEEVSRAMAKGGPDYAVGFCHLQSSKLTDSLSSAYKCEIKRISGRNRNPENAIVRESDQAVWSFYQQLASENARDTIRMDENEVHYYKPIWIKMKACLKCHGVPGMDMDQSVVDEIDSLYPGDQARNYQAGDLRGMWKISFPKN